MYHGERRKRVRSRSAGEKRSLHGREGAGGRGASLGEGRWVKQRTVEKWLPPGAGRRNIKGNRLLVREVKNRPSPGHTRIASIHLLYVLYHWSVIPFRPRRAAWRSETHAGLRKFRLPAGQTGWHDFIPSESFVLHTFLPLFPIFLPWTSLHMTESFA